MDDESFAALQTLAAETAGIPPELRSRLRGQTLGELRDDAARMAEELGIGKGRPRRDAAGKYSSADMSQLIREAAGRS